ncbi:hypothetical protein [Kitasatospora sp. NPDC056800]|uniref:hypothetical protein n=1 Tax=Kitasatospora sp. NPDC056800 TaxID=3345948 RepID=UPI003676E482
MSVLQSSTAALSQSPTADSQMEFHSSLTALSVAFPADSHQSVSKIRPTRPTAVC